MKTHRLVHITEATPLEGRRIRLASDDGSSGEVDLAPLLKGSVFEDVRTNDEIFRAVTIDPVARTIVWPNGADLDPCVLHDLAAEKPTAVS